MRPPRGGLGCFLAEIVIRLVTHVQSSQRKLIERRIIAKAVLGVEKASPLGQRAFRVMPLAEGSPLPHQSKSRTRAMAPWTRKGPAEAGQGFEATQCWYYFPSKMNCRTSLIALSRFGAIASRPDDFSQACAWSMFSNSVTPKRLGGSPSTAVIFSVGPAPPIHWPPAACIADASAGSYGGTEGRSMTSLSVTRYAFGLAWA